MEADFEREQREEAQRVRVAAERDAVEQAVRSTFDRTCYAVC